MTKLDAATIRRRIIVVIVFVAFVATLFIISSRQIRHLSSREQQLAQAGPEEIVELFLTSRAQGDLTAKMLCLTNELKLVLSGLSLGEGDEADYYDHLLAEEAAAQDRYLQSLAVHRLETVAAEAAGPAWDRAAFQRLYPYAADEDKIAFVAADYEARFSGAAADASGRYRQIYVVVQLEGGEWRIADWLGGPAS